MVIQRTSPVSSQITNILLERIHNDYYKIGENFPSEMELSHEFGVSRATIRTALTILSARGLLVRKPGIGTHLIRPLLLNTGLEHLESVLKISRNQGLSPEVRDLVIETVTPTPPEAYYLDCSQNTPLTKVCRAIYVSGTPVSYHCDYVLGKILSINDFSNQFEGSVLDLLENKHNLPIRGAKTEITAINANIAQSNRLKILPNTALIFLRETVYDLSNTIVSYSENIFVPERFYLHLIRRKI